MKKVGIIGGSGFIGSHITKVFLDHGFEVKVSATDISREDKYKHLMTFDHAENLHLSELNVTNEMALQDFVADCDIAIHAGTPFILDIKEPQTELFDPTIKETENFLSAIKNNSRIKKVIFIASIAAWNTNFPMPAEGKTTNDTFDENDSRFTATQSHPYAQSKFMANQVVEKFINENPNLNFEITTVSPVGVMGSSLSNRTDSTSGGLQLLIKNKMAPDPFMQMLFDNDLPFSLIDVRDVAKAIYKAATISGLHGKDYILATETYCISDMNLMLNQQQPMKEGEIIYKNDLAKKELGMTFKPVKECLFNF